LASRFGCFASGVSLDAARAGEAEPAINKSGFEIRMRLPLVAYVEIEIGEIKI
jgi:hypothetical protein